MKGGEKNQTVTAPKKVQQLNMGSESCGAVVFGKR